MLSTLLFRVRACGHLSVVLLLSMRSCDGVATALLARSSSAASAARSFVGKVSIPSKGPDHIAKISRIVQIHNKAINVLSGM